MGARKKEEPTVTVFGKEYGERQFKKYERAGNVVWGTFLLFVGSILILNTFGYLPWEVWDKIFAFWPTMLILVGVHIILGNNFLSRLLMSLLSVSVFGLIFLYVIQDPFPDLLSIFPKEVIQLVKLLENVKK
jgi:hypothetical protein